MHQKYGEIAILISGGEPFLYPDFLELIKKIVLMHSVKIVTNLSIDAARIINDFSPQQLGLCPSFHPYHADLEEFIEKLCALKQAGWSLGSIIVAYPPILTWSLEFNATLAAGTLLPAS